MRFTDCVDRAGTTFRNTNKLFRKDLQPVTATYRETVVTVVSIFFFLVEGECNCTMNSIGKRRSLCLAIYGA